MCISATQLSQAARLAKRNRTDFYKLLARHQLSSDEFKSRTSSGPAEAASPGIAGGNFRPAKPPSATVCRSPQLAHPAG